MARMKVRQVMTILQMTMKARPEKQAELLQTMLAMIESMRGEAGCRSYQVFQNIQNASSFSTIGEWDSCGDMNHYLKSDKFGVLLGMKSLLRTPMKIRVLSVSNSKGHNLVSSIRAQNTLIASHALQTGENNDDE
jgi:quinol monooxygenase YgiN